MVEIADSATDPRKAAVQISARQWVMARVNHQQWGDRRDVNTNLRAEIEAMTPEERDRRAKQLLERLRWIAGPEVNGKAEPVAEPPAADTNDPA